jgi:hypothetical protein
MHWLLIIVGVSNSGNLQPDTAWSDHATIQACKAAGAVAERIAPERGFTITGMSCVGHNPDNTVDFHFDTDGGWGE